MKIHWRCFHCGDTFTKAQERWAREHFGRDEGEQPVCLIRTAGEGGLLTALRNAQDELAAYRSDDGDLMRALLAMQADHAVALRDTEERGYAKGLADGRAEDTASARMEKALIRLRDCDWTIGIGDRMDPVREIAREGLGDDHAAI